MSYFHQTVATVVARDDHFLMVEEEAEGRIVLNQPAGHVEPGESLLAAALRETLEETAWQVELTGFIGLYQYTPPAGDLCFIRSCFSARPQRHEAWRELDSGIIRAHWLSHAELLRYRRRLRSPLVLAAVEDYLQHGPMPLQRVQQY